jgi:hypothetical protein
MILLLYFLLTISGMYFNLFLGIICYFTNMKIYNGQKGIDYYNEAHKSRFNKFIHMICMPITIYGMIIWISSLLCNNLTDVYYLNLGLFMFYFNHYLNINKKLALWLIVMYVPVIYMSYKYLSYEYNWIDNIIYGLKVSFGSLFIQETVGHYLGGDIPSRLEGVLNAILYAIYGSVEYSLLEFNLTIDYFRDNYIDRFWKDDDEDFTVLTIDLNKESKCMKELLNKLNKLNVDMIKINNVYSYYNFNTLKNFYLSKGYNIKIVQDNNKLKKILIFMLNIFLINLPFLIISMYDYINVFVIIYYNIISYNWVFELYNYNSSGILEISRKNIN